MYFGTFKPDPTAENTDPLWEIKAFLFHPPAARPEHPASPFPLENYAGTYTNNVYGTATVANAGGNLTLTFGKTPVTFYLSPWDGNTFRATCPQWRWGPVYDGRVSFSTDPDGTVRQLTTTLLLQKMFNQNATFVRTGAV